MPEIDDAAVESVMLQLLNGQVEIIQRFNQPLRDTYMENLRDYVRKALVRAFDPDARALPRDLAKENPDA